MLPVKKKKEDVGYYLRYGFGAKVECGERRPRIDK